MSEGFTKTEAALLEALERERLLLRQRDLINGIVVHELANAVTVVSGTAELLRNSLPNSPMYQFALTQLQGRVQTLNEMIRGLRTLVEGEGEQLRLTQGDLAEFVRSVATDPVMIHEAAVLRVAVIARNDAGTSTYCPTLLRHAVGNLVRNALKYSSPQKRVRIVVGARGPRQWIHVLNHGPRIEREIADHLFEPGRKSSRGGMGLGLHITRACTLRMGGQLVFGTTRGATVFSIVLPRREPAPAAPEPDPLFAGVLSLAPAGVIASAP